MKRFGDDYILTKEEMETVDKMIDQFSNILFKFQYGEIYESSLFEGFNKEFGMYKKFKVEMLKAEQAKSLDPILNLKERKFTAEQKIHFIDVFTKNGWCLRKAHRELIEELGKENAPSYETYRQLINKAKSEGVIK